MAVGLALRLGGRQGAPEVVERRQQLPRELAGAALLGGGDIARHPPAEVLEVGLRALREREVLVRLAGAREQRLEVVLDLDGGLLLGGGDRLGGRLSALGAGLLGRRLPRRGSCSALIVAALVHDLGVHDVLLRGVAAGARAVGAGALAVRARLLLGLLVHRLGDLVEGGLQRLGLRVDLVRVLGGERVADRLDRRLDLGSRRLVDAVAELLQLALGLVGGVLGVVARLGQLARLAVLVGVRLGVADHAPDLLVGEAGAALISIFCSLPVPRSFADTCRMPFASMSNATSICGMPRGAGGMPVSWNLPSDLL